MRLVLRHHRTTRTFRVQGVIDDATTVGDLVVPMLRHHRGGVQAGSLGPTATDTVSVDGVRTHLDTRVVDAVVVDGSEVSLERGDAAPAGRFGAPATIDITGGLAAGMRLPIDGRRLVVGRAADADVRIDASTVDPYHLALDPSPPGPRLTDLDSVNGTLVDGHWLLESDTITTTALVDLGAAQFMVRAAVDDRPDELLTLRGRTAAGTLPFNRPPRTAPISPSRQIEVPVEAPPSTMSALFSWAGLLAPLALGGLMALLYNPLWALFALLGPVMMVGAWIEGRRRDKKTTRRNRRAMGAALERLDVELDNRAGSELARLRARHPDLAEITRRVVQPSTALWERRLDHDDAMELLVGTGDVEWQLEPVAEGRPAPAALELLAHHGRIDNGPVVAPARSGQVIGLAGDRSAILAVARALVVQAAVHHGPADVELAVLARAEGADDWRWVEWLPHSRNRASRGRDRALAFGDAAIAQLVAGFIGASPDATIATAAADPMLLCVVDGDALTTGRAAPARALLAGAAGAAAGIVLASSRDRLPHSCSTVVEIVDPDGLGRVATPGSGRLHDDVLLTGMSAELATRTAQRLARFADPEVDLTEANIPVNVSLLELIGMTDPSPEAVSARWSEARGADSLAAPIGADGLGPLSIDLVRDGPHALVGGTTGSGKSELLRSFVAGLAATHDAEHLNFVLIDYKGGSAFDTCALLPHTVGLVTDLDEHLGARALQCLDAELHRRERVLRAAAATDIVDYHRTDTAATTTEPLPRLVVVIDEFATMATDLPDFLDALVGIAQRGRSLGVHLVLATQRPSGAVSPNIRTNTNLRVALRVLDAADSSDVINCPNAAGIGRDQPGRAFVRLGPTEVVPFQSALVTGHTRPGNDDALKVIPTDVANVADTTVETGGPCDLDRLVAAIRTAHDRRRFDAARRPWPEPLPAVVALDDLTASIGACADEVVIGLADEPHEQRQVPATWNPTAGNALLIGMPGSGTTTALSTIVCALADGHRPDRMHVYGIDQGAGELRSLEALPHVGSIVDASGRDRQLRLIRRLDDERRRRAGLGSDLLADEPRLVLIIDGYGSWRDELESDRHHATLDAFSRVYGDGPALGIHCVATGDHLGAVNRQLLATTGQIWLFRLADTSDYLAFGLRISAAAAMPPGRAFRSESGREVQFALAGAGGVDATVRRLAARYDDAAIGAPAIGELPTEIALHDLDARAQFGHPTWLPIGLGDDELAPVGFELYPGEHALIAGRARTGKTTSLCAMAQSLSASGVHVIALAPGRSALLAERGVSLASTDAAEATAAVAARGDRPTSLLVDDADTFDDVSGALAAVAASIDRGGAPFHIVAAGRTDHLLGSYGHWTTKLRSSRVGVLLCPDVLDGDLFSIQLPPRSMLPAIPGRGWFVSGGNRQVCQLAVAAEGPSASDEVTDEHRAASQRSRATRSS